MDGHEAPIAFVRRRELRLTLAPGAPAVANREQCSGPVGLARTGGRDELARVGGEPAQR